MLVGKRLFLGDADINLPTIERAARALRGYGARPLALDELAVAGSFLERCEAGRSLALPLLRPQPRGGDRGGANCCADEERARARAASHRPWEDRRRSR